MPAILIVITVLSVFLLAALLTYGAFFLLVHAWPLVLLLALLLLGTRLLGRRLAVRQWPVYWLIISLLLVSSLVFPNGRVNLTWNHLQYAYLSRPHYLYHKDFWDYVNQGTAQPKVDLTHYRQLKAFHVNPYNPKDRHQQQLKLRQLRQQYRRQQHHHP